MPYGRVQEALPLARGGGRPSLPRAGIRLRALPLSLTMAARQRVRKLLKADLAIAVLINVADHLVHGVITRVAPKSLERGPQHVWPELARAGGVEQLKHLRSRGGGGALAKAPFQDINEPALTRRMQWLVTRCLLRG